MSEPKIFDKKMLNATYYVIALKMIILFIYLSFYLCPLLQN